MPHITTWLRIGAADTGPMWPTLEAVPPMVRSGEVLGRDKGAPSGVWEGRDAQGRETCGTASSVADGRVRSPHPHVPEVPTPSLAPPMARDMRRPSGPASARLAAPPMEPRGEAAAKLVPAASLWRLQVQSGPALVPSWRAGLAAAWPASLAASAALPPRRPVASGKGPFGASAGNVVAKGSKVATQWKGSKVATQGSKVATPWKGSKVATQWKVSKVATQWKGSKVATQWKARCASHRGLNVAKDTPRSHNVDATAGTTSMCRLGLRLVSD